MTKQEYSAIVVAVCGLGMLICVGLAILLKYLGIE